MQSDTLSPRKCVTVAVSMTYADLVADLRSALRDSAKPALQRRGVLPAIADRYACSGCVARFG